MIPMATNTTAVPSSVPAFIAKLWHMVSDEKSDDLISWSEDETSFVIKDQARFCSQLLPRYYKHNNMASFIRQLNKYGFHKVSSIESSSLRNDKGDFEFTHEFFVKGCVQSLEMIKRKMTTASREIVDIKGDMTPLLQQLLLQVQELKDNHENFEVKINSMKRENDALWREHSILRQKYVKQQKMINKLIQFLVTLVQQTRSVNVKRSHRGVPLILKDMKQSQLMAIEAKKKESPVICEIDNSSSTSSTSKPNSKYILRGEDPIVSSPSAQSVLIHSPIEQTMIDPEESTSLFVAPDSPGDIATYEIAGTSPSGPFEPVVWCDVSSNIGMGSLGSPLSSFDIDDSLSTSTGGGSFSNSLLSDVISGEDQIEAKKGFSDKECIKTSKSAKIPIAVKLEPLDEDISITSSSTDNPTSSRESTPSITTGNQRKGTKRKEPPSSLVVSDSLGRQDLENHLDVVQTDLESLKDILQGIDTSAIMSLFTDQDPLDLNMTEGKNKQQLVSFNPTLVDITDMLEDEDADPCTSSGTTSVTDTSAIESLLNTPQPTPSISIDSLFTPKRLKK